MARKRGANEGSIYKRKRDGKWCAAIDLGYVKGKRRRKEFCRETRKEVAQLLANAIREKAQNLPMPVDRQTVGQFLEGWLENSVKRSKRPATYSSYSDTVRL